MQVLQWLFGRSHSHHHSSRATVPPGSRKRILSAEEEAKVNELILFTRGGACPSLHDDYEEAEEEENEKSQKTITILLTRDDSKTLFCSTLRLRHLRDLYGSRRFPHPRSGVYGEQQGMGHGVESALGGCKVLPICDAAFAGSKRSDCSDDHGKDARKGERRRAISRVKEFVRWAAAAKTHGGHKGWKVSYFRSRGNPTARADGFSSSSSKNSFRWEVGSCSTSSSVYSAMSLPSSSQNESLWVKQLSCAAIPDCNGNMGAMADPNAGDPPRSAQWITTDSDFVVLEL